ncbi:hypothetical protein AX14_003461 [Amanita brunnescens Koide BX004]|nr:hypothetical protein AX14_003461 [Amanita brunnescens Koide BX004]
MGHTPFSSNDDRHLVEYLTTHNPDGKGRRGNAIYQQLTSDTGRWPWSKRHPWQSWRDRYVKNDALMEKKIKVYRKNMVINDKEDAKQLSTKKADAVLGSCSGEQASNKKRERESLGSRVDASKRQKVADEQVNMERRCSVSGSSKNNAEPGTDMAREDGAEDEAGRKVAGSYVSLANEPESKPSHKLDEQSIERLRLMDNHDDDNEERQEVNEILVNVAGSGSIISEDQNTVRRASDASLRPPSVTRIEAATANSPVPHSDGSFNSLFDSDSSEHGSDSEKELNKASRKMAKSYQLPQRDDFFRSSPETDAALANGCDRPSAHKVKMAARRHPPTLVEGPFISTFVKTSQRISGNDGNESTDSSLPPNSPIKKTNLPTDDRRRLPVQDAMAASAEVFRERDDDGRTNAWPPSRKTLRAPSLTKETQEKQSGQAVEVLTQKVEKKPDNKTQRSLHRNDDMDSGQLVEKHERQHSNRQLGRVLGVESLPRSLKSLPETPGHVVATKSKMPPVDSVSISGDSHHFKLQPMCSEDKLIDLREERRRMAILRQSAGSSRSGSVAANHSISYGTRQSPSFSLHLSSQDQSFVASLGIQQAITMMSNNHGFTETVVSRILQTVNNIAKADEILRLMRVRAEELQYS